MIAPVRASEFVTTERALAELDRTRPAEAPCARCGVPTTRFVMGVVTAVVANRFGFTRVAQCLVCCVPRRALDVAAARAADPGWEARLLALVPARHRGSGFAAIDVAAEQALVDRMEAARAGVAGATAKDAALEAILWPPAVAAEPGVALGVKG